MFKKFDLNWIWILTNYFFLGIIYHDDTGSRWRWYSICHSECFFSVCSLLIVIVLLDRWIVCLIYCFVVMMELLYLYFKTKSKQFFLYNFFSCGFFCYRSRFSCTLIFFFFLLWTFFTCDKVVDYTYANLFTSSMYI